MQSILDNLYYGNLCPSEKPLIPGSPAEKAHAAFNDAAIQLEQTLSGTEKELFEAFADANQELCECSCCEYFSDGFRLGSLFHRLKEGTHHVPSCEKRGQQ